MTTYFGGRVRTKNSHELNGIEDAENPISIEASPKKTGWPGWPGMEAADEID